MEPRELILLPVLTDQHRDAGATFVERRTARFAAPERFVVAQAALVAQEDDDRVVGAAARIQLVE